MDSGTLRSAGVGLGAEEDESLLLLDPLGEFLAGTGRLELASLDAPARPGVVAAMAGNETSAIWLIDEVPHRVAMAPLVSRGAIHGVPLSSDMSSL